MKWLYITVLLCLTPLVLQSGCDGGQDGLPETPEGEATDDQSAEERGLCSAQKPEKGRYPLELELEDGTREYLLYIPDSIDLSKPSPLVLNFHGYTSNMYLQEIFSAMDETAEENGFILVYPNGLINKSDGETSWNAGGCCAYGEELIRDDLGFVRALVSRLQEELCIDTTRIYAAGFSNGGFMAHYLGCEASDVFAAVASVAGVLAIEPTYCTPSRAIPVIHFHGTRDQVVPYGVEGDEVYLTSVPETFAGWIDINGCEDAGSESYRKGDVSCVSHTECEDGVEVTLCTIQGMDHCWPGQDICPYGPSTNNISANDAIWQFFSKFSLPQVDK